MGFYNSEGDAEFMGFAVEPTWGEYWVGRLAWKERIAHEAARLILETGNGGKPMTAAQVENRVGKCGTP